MLLFFNYTFITPTVHDEPREIQFWVSNVNSSSFMSLSVRGYSLYRLNYPLAMKKWHHTCTSWNGKTGEWQLWVKSERVGRGFYNRVSSFYLIHETLQQKNFIRRPHIFFTIRHDNVYWQNNVLKYLRKRKTQLDINLVFLTFFLLAFCKA